MDLRFTSDELEFRDELRAFIRDHLPDDIRERMRLGYAPRKEDIVRLERVLVQEEHEAARLAGPFRPTASGFHRSVADCTRNLPLIVLMNAVADLTADAAAALDVPTRARHRQMNTQFHRQLFEAIRGHDGDAAYAIMARHVGDIQARVHRSLAQGQK